MAVKYYSDVLHKYYDSEEACLTAEQKFKTELEEGKKAQEDAISKLKKEKSAILALRKTLKEAEGAYTEHLKEYNKKYVTTVDYRSIISDLLNRGFGDF